MGIHNFNDNIQIAISAHGQWKLRLKQAIATGNLNDDPKVVALDTRCDFGKWMHGTTLTPEVKASKPYLVIKKLHAEFHVCAGEILSLAESGNTAKANDMMQNEFNDLAKKLMLTLTKWKMEMS